MIAIAPTDRDWFDLLRARPDLQQINFWTPTPWNIRQLEPGDRFYFLLKAPVRKTAGYGEFVRYEKMTARKAWEELERAMVRPAWRRMFARLKKYAGNRSDPATKAAIGPTQNRLFSA